MSGVAAAGPAAPARGLLPKLGLRFALSYLLVAAFLFSIYGFPFELFGARSDWLSGYLEMYARLAGAALRCFEPNILVTGNRVDGRFSLQIVRNCDAIEVNILFASAVLAFPAPWRGRLVALIGGLVPLVLLNVARICVLYFIGVQREAWFAVAHEEILPLVLIACTALIFLGWARYLVSPPQAPTQAPAEL
ncbi:MAG: archaeosortase/exosortase family protein [Polyangiaceae bacterium]